MIASIPDRTAGALRGGDPSQRHPDLGWSAGAYVSHVTDNLRIWAERLTGAALGGRRDVRGYDGDLLAQARVYEGVPIEGALWSLRRAAAAWGEAFRLAQEHGVVLLHPDRGDQTAVDVARTNAHDAFHHEWDIRRSLAGE